MTVLHEWIGRDGLPYRMVVPPADPMPGQKWDLEIRPPGREWMKMRDWNAERSGAGEPARETQ